MQTFEVSSKYLFKRSHLWPLYRPQKRLKLRSDELPQRFVVNYRSLESIFCNKYYNCQKQNCAPQNGNFVSFLKRCIGLLWLYYVRNHSCICKSWNAKCWKRMKISIIMHAKFHKYSCGFSHSKATITQYTSLESWQNFRFGEHKCMLIWQHFIKYNFRPKLKRWGKLYDLRFSLCRGL